MLGVRARARSSFSFDSVAQDSARLISICCLCTALIALQSICVSCLRADIFVDKQGALSTCSSVAISYRNNCTIDRTFRQTRSTFDIYHSSYPYSGAAYTSTTTAEYKGPNPDMNHSLSFLHVIERREKCRSLAAPSPSFSRT